MIVNDIYVLRLLVICKCFALGLCVNEGNEYSIEFRV